MFFGHAKTFGTLTSGVQWDIFSVLKTLIGEAPIDRGKNVLFWPKKLYIWDQKSIFCIVIAIFVNGAYNNYTRGYNFPIRTTPPKNSVSKLGVIFWSSPLFLALLGHSQVRGISTLNFGPISTKLGGTVWTFKKMTQNAGVSILMSYGENPHYVKLPIFSEFMENSTKFMKNSGLTKWTQTLR